MAYMLDTNICIYLIKRKPPQVLQRLRLLPIEDVAISSITYAELAYGVEKSEHSEQNREALDLFLGPLNILSFDGLAAFHYGNIRATLEKQGVPIGSLDLLIGAHAMSRSLILVTNNTREFERIEGLKIENWV